MSGLLIRMLAESSFIRIAVGAGKIAGLCDVERDRVGRNEREVSRGRGCKRRTEIQELVGAFPILAQLIKIFNIDFEQPRAVHDEDQRRIPRQ